MGETERTYEEQNQGYSPRFDKIVFAASSGKGFSYSPDSFLQRELEASFIYEDTPDQSKATIDVKADMESDRPMDRLVCGDVGLENRSCNPCRFQSCCR